MYQFPLMNATPISQIFQVPDTEPISSKFSVQRSDGYGVIIIDII